MTTESAHSNEICGMSLRLSPDRGLTVRLTGRWRLGAFLPEAEEVLRSLETHGSVARICFDAEEITAWDSSLLTFLVKIIDAGARKKIRVEPTGLPEGVQRLLKLASAVPPQDTAPEKRPPSFFARMGSGTVACLHSAGGAFEFIGEAFLSLACFLRGRASFRSRDLFVFVQDAGAGALPIVTLISLLVGLILAFVGAVQLKMFGAQIYVANLVGLGMAREMGAMMTGIIMAGRTGAAYAAQLGTMQVSEEVDALKTLGIPPMEFLVVPRMLALVVMMPFLCIYADFMGILGGAIVGTGLLDLSFAQYYEQTCTALRLCDFSLGLVKAVVFGVIAALSGCLRGMQCGRSSMAVGQAATSAVVTGIVWIVVADATLTVVYSILGI